MRFQFDNSTEKEKVITLFRKLLLCAESGEVTEEVEDITFTAFWAEWMNRKARPVAEKAFSKLSDEDKRACIAGAKVYFTWIQKGYFNSDYTPLHASTFINQRRWEDDSPKKEVGSAVYTTYKEIAMVPKTVKKTEPDEPEEYISQEDSLKYLDELKGIFTPKGID